MITSQEFEQLCNEEFKFLAKDFGFHVVSSRHHEFGSTVTFQNQTTAVEIQFESTSCLFLVALLRLIESKVPSRFENQTGVTNRIGFLHLIDLRNPDLTPQQYRFNIPPDLSSKKRSELITKAREEFSVEDARKVLRQYAVALRECADDVLRGDFEIFEAVGKLQQERLKETNRKTQEWLNRPRETRQRTTKGTKKNRPEG